MEGSPIYPRQTPRVQIPNQQSKPLLTGYLTLRLTGKKKSKVPGTFWRAPKLSALLGFRLVRGSQAKKEKSACIRRCGTLFCFSNLWPSDAEAYCTLSTGWNANSLAILDHVRQLSVSTECRCTSNIFPSVCLRIAKMIPQNARALLCMSGNRRSISQRHLLTVMYVNTQTDHRTL